MLYCMVLHIIIVSGCKHDRVDQKNALVYQDHNFLDQRPKSNSKALFKLDLFS